MAQLIGVSTPKDVDLGLRTESKRVSQSISRLLKRSQEQRLKAMRSSRVISDPGPKLEDTTIRVPDDGGQGGSSLVDKNSIEGKLGVASSESSGSARPNLPKISTEVFQAKRREIQEFIDNPLPDGISDKQKAQFIDHLRGLRDEILSGKGTP